MDNDKLTLHIDTSSLTSSAISEEVFNNDLRDKLIDILKTEFRDNYPKQQIKTTSTSLNFACPFCHDSATNNHKKRGHLILKGKFAGLYKCFNCGQSMSISKFFNEFDKNLSLSDIRYINDNLKSSSTYSNSSILSNAITSQIIDREEALKWAIDRNIIRDSFQLSDISKEATPFAYNYLINRCQYHNHERFLYSAKHMQLIILNLIDNKVLGMQLRNIDPHFTGNNKYLTMTIEKLRKVLYNDTSAIPETVSNLSCVFNIYNVDFAHTNIKPVLLTEGPFDAFLLPNCIATAGAAKNFKMSFPFWYIYDNDETGNKHSMEKLRSGYNTFMWKKFKQDYNIPDINPYIKNGNKFKWDITDVMKFFRDNKPSKQLFWSLYFTHDILNGLNI